MNKGFTLIELLLVLVIISVVSVGASIAFDNLDKDSNIEKRENLYKDIQRAATLYLDINDSWLEQFREENNEKNEIYISISELQINNFLSEKLVDPVTKEELSGSLTVKIFIAKESSKEYLDTYILKPTTDKSGVPIMKCISDSNGTKKRCCIDSNDTDYTDEEKMKKRVCN